MKKLLYLLLVLMLGFAAYWLFIKKDTEVSGPKQQALKASTHSAAFNTSVDSLLTAYFELKNAFVEADSIAARAAVIKLIVRNDSLKLNELKKDTVGIFESASMEVSDIKANAESLLRQTSLSEMLQDFRMVSENIYPFLKTIHYSGKMLYWQNCPMAFGEGKEANWISNTAEIVNPYLGKKHPEFKATMLHCGEVKDSIVSQ